MARLFAQHLFRALPNSGKPTGTSLPPPSAPDGDPAAVFIGPTAQTVVIAGTHYAGEIKKSVFFDIKLPIGPGGVFSMHVPPTSGAGGDVALFFGLSGTERHPVGRSGAAADRRRRARLGYRRRVQHRRWLLRQNDQPFREGEPQIWDAIRFGTVLENVVLTHTRVPDYDDGV